MTDTVLFHKQAEPGSRHRAESRYLLGQHGHALCLNRKDLYNCRQLQTAKALTSPSAALATLEVLAAVKTRYSIYSALYYWNCRSLLDSYATLSMAPQQTPTIPVQHSPEVARSPCKDSLTCAYMYIYSIWIYLQCVVCPMIESPDLKMHTVICRSSPTCSR